MDNLKIEQMTFGTCKICKKKPAIYSNKVCADCWLKKQLVVRELNNKNIEVGTKDFIDELKRKGVYY